MKESRLVCVLTYFSVCSCQVRFRFITSAAAAGVTSPAMADKEKRRSGATPPGMPESGAAKADADREFLSQAGVGELLRGAVLKMVEARSDDPIGFLADHFCHLASVADSGCGDAEHPSCSPGAQEQQRLNRALWHLRLAHHSQRFGQKKSLISLAPNVLVKGI